MARVSQPLAGLRVLDFGQVVAIPFATQWLAWMGADVVLVETRRHMTARALPPFAGDIEHPDRSGLFNGLNGTRRRQLPVRALPVHCLSLFLRHCNTPFWMRDA